MSYLKHQLAQAKHEIFARELVELMLLGDERARAKAYERAGYPPGTSMEDNARKLANKRDVKERVQQLFIEAVRYRDIRPAQIVIRIDRVGKANIADFYEDDGKTLKNIKSLPRELTDAIEAVKYNGDGNPELKLADKNAANFTLLKHFGGLPEPEAPRTTVNVFNALSIEDQSALADLIEAIPRRPGDSSEETAGEHSEA